MSNTFKKISARGFTLIELLVVIAIIGLLSTIIAAPIQSARKKARDAKKIAELKSTELALEQYAESNSAQYPTNLAYLSPQFMPVLSGFASSTTSTARDAFSYAYYTASSTGSQDSIFSYHLAVKLEVYGPALETDRDCVGGTLSSSLINPACSVYNGNFMFSEISPTGSSLSGAGATTSAGYVANFTTAFPAGTYYGQDFVSMYNSADHINKGKPFNELSTSTCVGVTDCIFDVTSQQ
jgi:prepilin-type N-terminal cleavage/methylation domain-containing protein